MTSLQTSKACRGCGEDKKLDDFYVDNTNVGTGRYPRCKSCCQARDRGKNYRRYGLTEKTFSELCEAQDGCCAICRRSLDFTPGTSGFAIDHNHTTQAVRGVLCNPCNSGIGLLQDSPSVLEKAIRYLNDNGHYGPKEAGSSEAAS